MWVCVACEVQHAGVLHVLRHTAMLCCTLEALRTMRAEGMQYMQCVWVRALAAAAAAAAAVCWCLWKTKNLPVSGSKAKSTLFRTKRGRLHKERLMQCGLRGEGARLGLHTSGSNVTGPVIIHSAALSATTGAGNRFSSRFVQSFFHRGDDAVQERCHNSVSAVSSAPVSCVLAI